jgi:hypothetical protein
VQHWLPVTMSEPAAADEIAALFEALVIAMDAAYGYVVHDSRTPRPHSGNIEFDLPGVFWLNYFGPAFLALRPELTAAGGARTLPTGGTVVRTTKHGQTELRTILGEQAFQRRCPNPSLPTIDQHVAASPGTTEMPWVTWLANKTVEDRGKKHAGARKRLAKVLAGRTEPVLAADAVEWSASLDLTDWRDFAKYLTRKLRGDFATALGKAVITVVTTAPVDDEETVDAYVFGPREARRLCEQWLE